MIDAAEFLGYCAGVSMLVLTGVGSASLLIHTLRGRGRGQRKPSAPSITAQEPANDPLVDQLTAFRQQRFAPEIGRTQPPGDAGPRPPGAPAPNYPFSRPLQPNRPPVVRQFDPRSQRPKRTPDNVVTLPLKDTPPKKED